jgi:hypothetical protein
MANEITANPAELRKFADEIGKCHTVYAQTCIPPKVR